MPSKTLVGAETEYGFTVERLDAVRANKIPSIPEVSNFIAACVEASGVSYYSSSGNSRDLLSVQNSVREISERAMEHGSSSQTGAEDQLRVMGISGLRLGNGARFYQDCGHPEYSTPECTSATQLVAYYRAGDLLVEAGRLAKKEAGGNVYLYRDNSDRNGSSFAAHENYLMDRRTFNQLLIYPTETPTFQFLETFFVTRQVVFGAGKVGVESDSRTVPSSLWVPYQLSQRGDFILKRGGIDTMVRRPIVNLRYMPYADRAKYARLHVICGDANMCEVALWLKFGITSLVLKMLEDNFIASRVPRGSLSLKYPVWAVHSISRDPSLEQVVELQNQKKVTALEIQRVFHELLTRYIAEEYDASDEERRIVTRYGEVLDALEDDPMRLVGVLDWVSKYLFLLSNEENGTDWQDSAMTTSDVLYHSTNPDEGLYLWLEERGHVERVVADEDILRALTEPPNTTRAYFRGKFVDKFASVIRSMTWDYFRVQTDQGTRCVDVQDLFLPDEAKRIIDLATNAELCLRELERIGFVTLANGRRII